MTSNDPLAELLLKHQSMGYGAGSPIRCECRKVLKGELGDRYKLLAQHQAEMVRAAGILGVSS